MTNEQAINYLKQLYPNGGHCWLDKQRIEAIGMAIQALQQPVSEDLEKAGKEWLKPQLDKSYANYGEAKMMELTHFNGYAMLDAIEFGANWQKQKDNNDANHALVEQIKTQQMWYEKGMADMKQKMMANAVDGTFSTGELADGTPIDAIFNFDKEVRNMYEEGEKLKLIVIKEE